MIKILTNIDEYMPFVHEINSDPNFCDPMLSTEEQIRCNLLSSVNKPTNKVFGVFDGDAMTGLFVFLILSDESYAEMLVGLSKDEKAYDEMMNYLQNNYKGYDADFVYNPGNHILHQKLKEVGASYEVEQQKMVLTNDVEYKGDKEIVLYSPEYREQYIAMHSLDVFWTAEKVIDAPDKFRIILAVEKGEVVGYIDITTPYDENEPYDVLVKEEYRCKGYGKAMLAKAIELNKPKNMMLLVDIDNLAAMALYESMGFVKSKTGNNLTAHVRL